jgi:hypothetical protein
MHYGPTIIPDSNTENVISYINFCQDLASSTGYAQHPFPYLYKCAQSSSIKVILKAA